MHDGPDTTLYSIIGLLIIFVPAIYWVYRCKRDRPEDYAHLYAKDEIGPDKPKKMLSWEGALYILWNWKTYLLYTLMIASFFLCWYELTFAEALVAPIFVWVLSKLGKLF